MAYHDLKFAGAGRQPLGLKAGMCFLKHIASALQPLFLLGFNSGSYFPVLPLLRVLLCLQIAEVLGICGTDMSKPWLTTRNWHTEAIKRQPAMARGKSLTVSHTFTQDVTEDPALRHDLQHAGEMVGTA